MRGNSTPQVCNYVRAEREIIVRIPLAGLVAYETRNVGSAISPVVEEHSLGISEANHERTHAKEERLHVCQQVRTHSEHFYTQHSFIARTCRLRTGLELDDLLAICLFHTVDFTAEYNARIA